MSIVIIIIVVVVVFIIIIIIIIIVIIIIKLFLCMEQRIKSLRVAFRCGGPFYFESNFFKFALSSTSRNLAEIFMVLPTRKELPDYYQIIKHPVDIRKIRVSFLVSSLFRCHVIRITFV